MGSDATFGLVEKGGRIHRFDASDKSAKEEWMMAIEPAIQWQKVKVEVAAKQDDTEKQGFLANAWNKAKITDRKKENKGNRNDVRAKYGLALEQ
jgi:hypothetical protein